MKQSFLFKLPSQFVLFYFKFKVGDLLRVFHITVVTGKLKRFIFEGLCISKRNKGISSSLILRSSYMGFDIDHYFSFFGPNILSISKLLFFQNYKKQYSKLYFLKKKYEFKIDI